MRAGTDDGRRWLIGIVSVLAAGAAVLALRGGVTDSDPAPTPTPPLLSTYESPPPVPTESPRPPTALAYQDLCDVATDHRSTLRVVFSLVNTGPAGVTLLEVTPLLPLPRPTPVGTTVRGGACTEPGRPLSGGVVAPRAQAVVTMDFTLPPECPKPYPVQAIVTERVGGVVRTGEVTLLNDLGPYDFDTCDD